MEYLEWAASCAEFPARKLRHQEVDEDLEIAGLFGPFSDLSFLFLIYIAISKMQRLHIL